MQAQVGSRFLLLNWYCSKGEEGALPSSFLSNRLICISALASGTLPPDGRNYLSTCVILCAEMERASVASGAQWPAREERVVLSQDQV